MLLECCTIFFFQAEDGIRDLVRSRGLGDVYKRQRQSFPLVRAHGVAVQTDSDGLVGIGWPIRAALQLSLIHI